MSQPYLEVLEPVASGVIASNAVEVDRTGSFPRQNMEALHKAGLLGLISATEVGGMGEGMRAATMAVERIARECASTAMITCMHYAAMAVLEKFGTHAERAAVTNGMHLSTLAFSEVGSRSHFWAPVSTATQVDGHVTLNAAKSWVTSAGEADSYVWSSKPVSAEGASTLWLVSSKSTGLNSPASFNGLGLRGNASSAVMAHDVSIPAANRLGEDGKGFDVMMGVVLPHFSLMSAAMSVGTMRSAVARTVAHVTGTKFQHLDSALADLPTIRAYIARMQIKTDMVNTLLLDALTALETGRADGMLRVLEIKAAAGETATEVTDMAMRVCGGAAFRKEVGVERNFRDARAATVMAPTTDVLYDFIGKAVCGMPLF